MSTCKNPVQKALFSDDTDSVELLKSWNNYSSVKPLFIPAPDFYKMCPYHDTCPGFISKMTQRGMHLVYCHYLQCPDLLAHLPVEYKKMVLGSVGAAPRTFTESPERVPTDDEWGDDSYCDY